MCLNTLCIRDVQNGSLSWAVDQSLLKNGMTLMIV
jgi:hypothetical protein